MSKEVLDVMDLRKGHEEINFDPEDPKDVKKVVKKLRELLDKGFYVYARFADGAVEAIQPKDIKRIHEKEITEFVTAGKRKGQPRKAMTATIPKKGG